MARRAAGEGPKRATKPSMVRCWICKIEYAVSQHEPETGTCGDAACVEKVWRARLRMAEARLAVNRVRLEPRTTSILRADGRPLLDSSGAEMQGRHPDGGWTRVEGGPADARDQAAYDWAAEQATG